MVSEQNPLDLNVFMFIVCYVWILRLSSCRNMQTSVFLLWFNLHMIFTTDPKLYVWSSNKQLLMQKLLIDEFRYSTCCNKFRTFIIKVTSICNIYFTEIKKIYSLRHITMMLYLLKMMKIPGTHAFTNLNAAIQMLAKNITWVCGTMCNHAVFHIASPDQQIKGMNRLVYF